MKDKADKIVSTYKEFPITFESETGLFVANVDGERIAKPSIAAMKKHIDGAEKNSFKPFDAMASSYMGSADIPGTDLKKFTIVGRRSNGRKYKPGLVFLFERYAGNRHVIDRTVYTISPESIAAAKAIKKHEAETNRIRDERQAELEKLEAALETFKIDPNKI